jgi:hypothetical protein
MTSILDKLEKLKAMRDQTGSPAEAAVAISKMQKIMEEHNLTEKDLDRYQLGEIRIKSTQSVSNIKDWELGVMEAAAEAFGGKVLWVSGKSWKRRKDGSKYRNPDPFGTFILIGFKAALPMMEYAATFLLRAIVNGRREMNLTLPRDMPRQIKTYELDGFCQGFIYAVRQKIVGLGIDPLILEWAADRVAGRPVKQAQDRSGGQYGINMGLEAGEALDLNRPMSAVGSTLALEHQP